MKLLAITSALLAACSSAAAVASPAEPFNDGLKARDADADAAPMPGWWGFKWSRHGTAGWKRDADAAAEPVPGWWGFKWSRHGTAGWKRDATPEPVPGWWGFRWSRHGGPGWKRDVAAAADGAESPEDDTDFIYLPKGMNPDDLAAMIQDAKAEKEAKKETKA